MKCSSRLAVALIGIISVYGQTQRTLPTTALPHPPGSCEWNGRWYNDGTDIERNESDGCKSGLICDSGQIIAWDGAGCFGITTGGPPTVKPPTPIPPEMTTSTSCLYNGTWYNDGEEISREVVGRCVSGMQCFGGAIGIFDGVGCFGPWYPSTTDDEVDPTSYTTDYTDSTGATEQTVTGDKEKPGSGGSDEEETDCQWQGELITEGQETRTMKDDCEVRLICSKGKMISGNKNCLNVADDPQQRAGDGRGGAAMAHTYITDLLLPAILCIKTLL